MRRRRRRRHRPPRRHSMPHPMRHRLPRPVVSMLLRLAPSLRRRAPPSPLPFALLSIPLIFLKPNIFIVDLVKGRRGTGARPRRVTPRLCGRTDALSDIVQCPCATGTLCGATTDVCAERGGRPGPRRGHRGLSPRHHSHPDHGHHRSDDDAINHVDGVLLVRRASVGPLKGLLLYPNR